jgi:UDP-glucuronate 4-epimerase
MPVLRGSTGSLAGSSPILVTGAAGFIGFHTALRYLKAGVSVVGLDNLNDYYDPGLKQARLNLLAAFPEFEFIKLDLASPEGLNEAFRRYHPQLVVHLAAQAGVRYAAENPLAYGASNLTGFLNVLEACRHAQVGHLVYASSSSVYGMNAKVPYAEGDDVDHPVSLYAATKRANELMAHAYSHQFGIPTTGLRFFTVYGPYGRPDMAYFLFAKNILEGKPITVYRSGTLERDFTYIDDIVEAVVRIGDVPAAGDPHFDRGHPAPQRSSAPFRIYNIGNHHSETVNALIAAIERSTNRTAERVEMPMPPGDVEKTFAQVDALSDRVGFSPATPLETGIERFVDWYRHYYNV